MKLDILKKEVKYRASRSSGKGGQHVNKVSTRIELLFDVANSDVLTALEKEVVFEKLANRINSESILLVASQAQRSQLMNKQRAFKKLEHLLTAALEVPKKRIAVKPTKGMVESRLKNKRIHSEKKGNRKKVFLYDS